jgi:hypothetical protein
MSLNRWEYGWRQESVLGGFVDRLERLNDKASGQVKSVDGRQSLEQPRR